MPEDNFKEKIIEILNQNADGDWVGFEDIANQILKATDQEIETRLRNIGVGIANCKRCNKEIVFIRTKLGNFMPVCLDLKSHFIDCPGAKQFRKDRAKKEV